MSPPLTRGKSLGSNCPRVVYPLGKWPRQQSPGQPYGSKTNPWHRLPGVWVKNKPSEKPQILVHVSIYQEVPFWGYPIFDPQHGGFFKTTVGSSSHLPSETRRKPEGNHLEESPILRNTHMLTSVDWSDKVSQLSVLHKNGPNPKVRKLRK